MLREYKTVLFLYTQPKGIAHEESIMKQDAWLLFQYSTGKQLAMVKLINLTMVSSSIKVLSLPAQGCLYVVLIDVSLKCPEDGESTSAPVMDPHIFGARDKMFKKCHFYLAVPSTLGTICRQ